MSEQDGFFIGWSNEAPRADRRLLLGASLGLWAAAGGAGALMAQRKPGPQPGRWDQGEVRPYSGTLVDTPYPTLLTQGQDGTLQAMLLVGYGKSALPRLGGGPVSLEVLASAITRGRYTMLAVQDAAAYANAPRTPTTIAALPEEDMGPVNLLGEIVDAKCWFGAMNPGLGLTHKACAALCARGGLPLAFCGIDLCGGTDEIWLCLDEQGKPHGRDLVPFVADPVFAEGRLVRRQGLIEFRVARSALTRV